ncbi:MAG: hypothetical protein GX663_04075 [Clostridiales bacterium]|nr:hypothetical protein [Clostridiales bacterium]
MTITSIMIAVALVAIIVILIIIFTVWKRETKLRTDSMWAIADSLERAEYLRKQKGAELSADKPVADMKPGPKQNPIEEFKPEPFEPKPQSQLQLQPEFKPEPEPKPDLTKDYGEISLDFYDDIDDADIQEYKLSETYTGTDVGKSGKKYTAEELAMLIKE